MKFFIRITFLLVMIISPSFQQENIFKIPQKGRATIDEDKLKELATDLASPTTLKEAFKLQNKLADKKISEDEMKVIEYLLDYPYISQFLPNLHDLLDEPIPSSQPIKDYCESCKKGNQNAHFNCLMQKVLNLSRDSRKNCHKCQTTTKDTDPSKQLNNNEQQNGGSNKNNESIETYTQNNNLIKNELNTILSNKFDDEIKENITKSEDNASNSNENASKFKGYKIKHDKNFIKVNLNAETTTPFNYDSQQRDSTGRISATKNKFDNSYENHHNDAQKTPYEEDVSVNFESTHNDTPLTQLRRMNHNHDQNNNESNAKQNNLTNIKYSANKNTNDHDNHQEDESDESIYLDESELSSEVLGMIENNSDFEVTKQAKIPSSTNHNSHSRKERISINLNNLKESYKNDTSPPKFTTIYEKYFSQIVNSHELHNNSTHLDQMTHESYNGNSRQSEMSSNINNGHFPAEIPLNINKEQVYSLEENSSFDESNSEVSSNGKTSTQRQGVESYDVENYSADLSQMSGLPNSASDLNSNSHEEQIYSRRFLGEKRSSIENNFETTNRTKEIESNETYVNKEVGTHKLESDSKRNDESDVPNFEALTFTNDHENTDVSENRTNKSVTNNYNIDIKNKQDELSVIPIKKHKNRKLNIYSNAHSRNSIEIKDVMDDSRQDPTRINHSEKEKTTNIYFLTSTVSKDTNNDTYDLGHINKTEYDTLLNMQQRNNANNDIYDNKKKNLTQVPEFMNIDLIPQSLSNNISDDNKTINAEKGINIYKDDEPENGIVLNVEIQKSENFPTESYEDDEPPKKNSTEKYSARFLKHESQNQSDLIPWHSEEVSSSISQSYEHHGTENININNNQDDTNTLIENLENIKNSSWKETGSISSRRFLGNENENSTKSKLDQSGDQEIIKSNYKIDLLPDETNKKNDTEEDTSSNMSEIKANETYVGQEFQPNIQKEEKESFSKDIVEDSVISSSTDASKNAHLNEEHVSENESELETTHEVKSIETVPLENESEDMEDASKSNQQAGLGQRTKTIVDNEQSKLTDIKEDTQVNEEQVLDNEPELETTREVEYAKPFPSKARFYESKNESVDMETGIGRRKNRMEDEEQSDVKENPHVKEELASENQSVLETTHEVESTETVPFVPTRFYESENESGGEEEASISHQQTDVRRRNNIIKEVINEDKSEDEKEQIGNENTELDEKLPTINSEYNEDGELAGMPVTETHKEQTKETERKIRLLQNLLKLQGKEHKLPKEINWDAVKYKISKLKNSEHGTNERIITNDEENLRENNQEKPIIRTSHKHRNGENFHRYTNRHFRERNNRNKNSPETQTDVSVEHLEVETHQQAPDENTSANNSKEDQYHTEEANSEGTEYTDDHNIHNSHETLEQNEDLYDDDTGEHLEENPALVRHHHAKQSRSQITDLSHEEDKEGPYTVVEVPVIHSYDRDDNDSVQVGRTKTKQNKTPKYNEHNYEDTENNHDVDQEEPIVNPAETLIQKEDDDDSDEILEERPLGEQHYVEENMRHRDTLEEHKQESNIEIEEPVLNESVQVEWKSEAPKLDEQEESIANSDENLRQKEDDDNINDNSEEQTHVKDNHANKYRSHKVSGEDKVFQSHDSDNKKKIQEHSYEESEKNLDVEHEEPMVNPTFPVDDYKDNRKRKPAEYQEERHVHRQIVFPEENNYEKERTVGESKSNRFIPINNNEDNKRIFHEEYEESIPARRFRNSRRGNSRPVHKHLHNHDHKYLKLDGMTEKEHETEKEVTRRHSNNNRPKELSQEEIIEITEDHSATNNGDNKRRTHKKHYEHGHKHLFEKRNKRRKTKQIDGTKIHMDENDEIYEPLSKPYIFVKGEREKYQFIKSKRPDGAHNKKHIIETEDADNEDSRSSIYKHILEDRIENKEELSDNLEESIGGQQYKEYDPSRHREDGTRRRHRIIKILENGSLKS